MFRQRRILRDYGPQPLLFLVGKQTVTRPLGIICHQVSGVVPSPEAELLRNPAPGVPLVAGKSSLVVAMLFFRLLRAWVPMPMRRPASRLWPAKARSLWP